MLTILLSLIILLQLIFSQIQFPIYTPPSLLSTVNNQKNITISTNTSEIDKELDEVFEYYKKNSIPATKFNGNEIVESLIQFESDYDIQPSNIIGLDNYERSATWCYMLTNKSDNSQQPNCLKLQFIIDNNRYVLSDAIYCDFENNKQIEYTNENIEMQQQSLIYYNTK
jgi:hypothetical protein